MTSFGDKQRTLMRRMEASFASGTDTPTIVPMQTDFIHDPKLALTLVSYIPEHIAAKIRDTIITPLRETEPDLYYYPVDSLHLTVQNVRVIHDPPNFTDTDVARMHALITESIPSSGGPFRFGLEGLLSMPTSVSVIALVQPGYDRFVRRLRTSMASAGIPDDKTYFTNDSVFGNITVCRYTHTPSPQFITALEKLRDVSVGPFVIDQMSLVTMNAGAHPSKTRVHGSYRFA